MMITGAHTLIFSANPEADRAFLHDVLGLSYVDAGEGWLIFGLPPAEVAMHPADDCSRQAFYLTCDNLEVFIQEMKGQGISYSTIQDQPWGRLTKITLPDDGKLGVYQASHVRPIQITE